MLYANSNHVPPFTLLYRCLFSPLRLSHNLVRTTPSLWRLWLVTGIRPQDGEKLRGPGSPGLNK